MKAREQPSGGVTTPGHALVAICVDPTTISEVWMEIDGKDARIQDLHVYEEYREHGRSKTALLTMAEGPKHESVRYLNVTVIAPNTDTIDIYKSVGFRVTARHVVLELPTLASLIELQPAALAQAVVAPYRLGLHPYGLVRLRTQALD